MKVICPSCSEAVPVEDVNVVKIVAKCRSCNSVFKFDDQLGPSPTPAPRLAKVPVPLPAGLTLVEGTESAPVGEDYRTAPGSRVRGLRITRRWFGPQHVFTAFFCIAWDSFLVFWYGIAFKTHAPWLMFVFPIAHLAVGVGLTYSAIAGIFNKTVIEVRDGKLTVRHGPIPVWGNRTIPVEDVRQLYTEEIVGSKGAKSYTLQAILAQGPTVALAKDLKNPQQALFIERTVEEHLDIADEPVAGAFTG